jgi:hypothetical protein
MSTEVASTFKVNPFGANKISPAQSTYAAWLDGKIVYPFETERSPTTLAGLVHQSFRSHVLNQEFPCVGAKAAINNNAYRFGSPRLCPTTNENGNACCGRNYRICTN